MPAGYVYILGNDTGTLYIGVTSNLGKRILEHKRGEGSDFTTLYGCHRLLYVEHFEDIRTAIARETSLKGKTRQKKLVLIRAENPEFQDLAATWGWPRIGPQQSKAETDEALKQWIFPTPELRATKRKELLERNNQKAKFKDASTASFNEESF